MKTDVSTATNGRYVELFDSLVRVSKGLNNVSSIKQMAALLQAESNALFKLTDVWLYLFDNPRGNKLHHVAGVGEHADIMAQHVPMIDANNDPIFKKMLRQRKLFYTEDILIEDDANKDVLPKIKLRTVVNYPLFIEGSAIGVMAFGSFGDQVVSLSKKELDYFDIITEQTAQAVSRMHFYDKSQQDHLTKLSNRYGLEHKLSFLRQHLPDPLTKFCFIYIDLNKFKQINDSHGHLTGDHILKQFSHNLTQEFRSADIIARVGGDEFVLVFSLVKSDFKVDALIERIRTRCCSLSYDNLHFELDFAWGHVIGDFQDHSISQLMEIADENMYQLKQAQIGSAH